MEKSSPVASSVESSSISSTDDSSSAVSSTDNSLWDAERVFRIRNDWNDEIYCPGLVSSDSAKGVRCTRRKKNEEDFDKIDALLETMSKNPPTAVTRDQRTTLASLWLCKTHQDQQESITKHLRRHLEPIQELYKLQEAKDEQLTWLQRQLCRMLQVKGDDCPDERIVEALRKILRKMSLRGREHKALKAKVTKANEELEQANVRITEQAREAGNLKSHVGGLEQQLKD